MENILGAIVKVFILIAALWELFSGRTKGGRKTSQDWWMAFLAAAMMIIIQRPLLTVSVALIMTLLLPGSAGALTYWQEDYFWWCLVGFFCIEEFLHGSSHYFAHTKRPKNKTLQWIQAFYKMNHRPHHLSGGQDNKGQISVTQTFVNGWAWWLILPNYWFQVLTLYLGLTEVFLVGTAFKGLWAAHTHVNWNYDLYLLNHKYKWERTLMWWAAHIITFPTQHHQHHSRGKNSMHNLTATLAIYDWLIFKTLAIETSKPNIYGWRQNDEEANSVLKRYFNISVKKYLP